MAESKEPEERVPPPKAEEGEAEKDKPRARGGSRSPSPSRGWARVDRWLMGGLVVLMLANFGLMAYWTLSRPGTSAGSPSQGILTALPTGGGPPAGLAGPPGEPFAEGGKVQSLLRQGRFREALEEARKGVAEAPQDPAPQGMHAEAALRWAWENPEGRQKLLEEAREALEALPAASSRRAELEAHLAVLEGDDEGAVKAAEKAASAPGADLKDQVRLALIRLRAALKKGDREEIAAVLRPWVEDLAARLEGEGDSPHVDPHVAGIYAASLLLRAAHLGEPPTSREIQRIEKYGKRVEAVMSEGGVTGFGAPPMETVRRGQKLYRKALEHPSAENLEALAALSSQGASELLSGQIMSSLLEDAARKMRGG